MRFWSWWLLGLAVTPVPLTAQTDLQSNVRSPWRAPERERPRNDMLLRTIMLRAHNDARQDVNVPPLRWDPVLAEQAEGYARELAHLRKFQHSNKAKRLSPQSENLWMGTRDAFFYTEMAATWANERRFYRHRPVPDYSTTGDWRDAGHYAQMVWKDTTTLGCGLASNDSDDYLVCRYAPPGNVFGRTIFGEP